MSLGAMLRARRAQLQYSQRHVARRARVAQSTICRLEADKHSPGADTLAQLAQALHFTPTERTQLFALAGTQEQEGED